MSGIVTELRAEVVVPYKKGYEPMRAPPSELMKRAANEIERLTKMIEQLSRGEHICARCYHRIDPPNDGDPGF